MDRAETRTIQNDRLLVDVLPFYGARVVTLVDKRSGRDWLTQGGLSDNVGEDASYGGGEAVGWDECFPTVSPIDAGDTAWRRRLRDHGDLWGRPWQVGEATATRLALTYVDPQFRFSRALGLDGASLIADYAVENSGTEPLPYLWALHALLAVRPGDSIELPGVETVRPTYLTHRGRVLSAAALPWSTRSDVLSFGLDRVQPPEAGFAGKFFASGLGGTARIGRPGEALRLSWDPSLAHLGIWLTYGGWPGPGGNEEIAIEPTNAEADHLGEAMAAGAVPLAPGEQRTWRISFKVGE